MAYYIDLFSPETYERFLHSDRTVTGFRKKSLNTARKMKVGDKLICYLTKLSRWIGVLEITSPCFEDKTPRFLEEDDPFVVRFKVKPIVLLEKDKAIPIKDSRVWNTLSFTKGLEHNSTAWTGKVRGSLVTWMNRMGNSLKNSY